MPHDPAQRIFAASGGGGRRKMKDVSSLHNVLAAYCPEPSGVRVAPLGAGNINDTYLVQSGDGAFVLQRINGRVFSSPLSVIRNFDRITAHLQPEGSSSAPLLRVASPVKTLSGCSHYVDENGNYWRAQTYIPHRSKRVLSGWQEARQVGVVLAVFHSRLDDFGSLGLVDPLPGFHNLTRYLQTFDTVARKKSRKMGRRLRYCLDIVNEYRDRAAILTKAVDAGVLKLQPVHGDPKLDNFLFNDHDECFGMLDLDTVSIGLVHHDIGDCLRSCCNLVGETGGDTSEVSFDLQRCRALLDGYFSVIGDMDRQQRHYIFDGVLLICFELGLRFLTDYLDGSHYFRIEKDDDNLARAFNQFCLTVDVERKEHTIRSLVEDVASSHC